MTYTLSFGPSYQSEQCVEIQIINDSLAEGWERLTVQLTTNSSAIDLATPQFKIYIKPNDGTYNLSTTCIQFRVHNLLYIQLTIVMKAVSPW